VLRKGVNHVFVASGYLTAFARLSFKARARFICLHGGVANSIDVVFPSWRRYSVKPSHKGKKNQWVWRLNHFNENRKKNHIIPYAKGKGVCIMIWAAIWGGSH